MIKIVTATAVAALVAAAVVVLPGIAPEVSARVPDQPGVQEALVKADRLGVPSLGNTCIPRAWPYYDRECLFDTRFQGDARKVRVITTDRIETPTR